METSFSDSQHTNPPLSQDTFRFFQEWANFYPDPPEDQAMNLRTDVQYAYDDDDNDGKLNVQIDHYQISEKDPMLSAGNNNNQHDSIKELLPDLSNLTSGELFPIDNPGLCTEEGLPEASLIQQEQLITPNMYGNHSYVSAMTPGPTHSAIPSNVAYPGDYRFNVTCGKPAKSKSACWTYDELGNKLYVKPLTPCPFLFSTGGDPPDGCIIRAMAIYLKPEHVQEIVKRCPNHASTKEAKEHIAPHHLVRCDNTNSTYDDGTYNARHTNRHSVIIPYEVPQAGTPYVQHLYRFMCYNSCVGGLNRRPIQLIFTLEHGDEVLGRKAIEVRICACPGRDRRTVEKNVPDRRGGKRPKSAIHTTEVTSFSKKPRTTDKEIFTLQVEGRENYELLLKIKQSLELSQLVDPTQMQQYQQQQAHLQKQPSKTRILTVPTTLRQTSEVLNTTNDVLNSTTPVTAQLQRSTAKEVSPPLQVTSGSIAEWLAGMGLAAYSDDFALKGLTHVSQLDDFTLEMLDSMKIGSAHRNKIWKAILDLRQSHVTSSQQDIGAHSASSSGTMSVGSQTFSNSQGFNPGYFEVTRYTFKHSIKLKEEPVYIKRENSDTTNNENDWKQQNDNA